MKDSLNVDFIGDKRKGYGICVTRAKGKFEILKMLLDVKAKDLYRALTDQTAETIVLPDSPTNGDVIEAVFPNVSIYKHGSTYSINNEYNFNETWWNAPYKREVEE